MRKKNETPENFNCKNIKSCQKNKIIAYVIPFKIQKWESYYIVENGQNYDLLKFFNQIDEES